MKRLNRLSLLMQRCVRFPQRVHGDQRGSISIISVFTIFMLTMLMVMVINVGRHVDDKLRMQNAADAAAYSGSVVVARGMNALAFSNHLLCEVFALTAYMREGAEPTAATIVPDMLSAWARIAPEFLNAGTIAGIPKFANLGPAIAIKVPLEQDLVDAFHTMTIEHSRLTLPVLEHILAGPEDDPTSPDGGYIPRFQRVVVRSIPLIADTVCKEVTRRYGQRYEAVHANLPLAGFLWQVTSTPAGGKVVGVTVDEDNPDARTLPAIDPSPSGPDGSAGTQYLDLARRQRRNLANRYLRGMQSPDDWIRHWMSPYFSYASGNASRGLDGVVRYNRPGRDTGKFSQLINLWRIFACAHLNDLLDREYVDRNLPHVIRQQSGMNSNQVIEHDHSFVSVVYWPHLREMFPGLFSNPLHRDNQSDAFAFAQATVYLPRSRYRNGPWVWRVYYTDQFGVQQIRYINHYDNWPSHWDLLNQNWAAKLVPATSQTIPDILQQQPPGLTWYTPPNLGGADIAAISRVSMH